MQIKFTNDSADARTVGLDMGCPFFSRLQIMSGGQELEDIGEYSRLYSILESIQGSRLTADEHSLTEHQNFTGVAAVVDANITDLSVSAAAVNTQVGVASGNYLHNVVTQVANAGTKVYNVPLVSAIFNIEKYFPLLLTQQGIDIYLTLNPTADIGAWSGAPTQYKISDVKYIAHEVNLDDAFVNQMKASIQATGGVLSLASTTYRHYLNNQTGANPTTATHNVSTQVKSLKGLIVRPQNNALNGANAALPISTGQSMQIDSIQFKVGSILFPQEPIAFNAANPGEMYNEIRKCFGTIGSYNHGTMLNKSTFKVMANTAADKVPPAGGTRQLWAAAYDFETFAKSATELTNLAPVEEAKPLLVSCCC